MTKPTESSFATSVLATIFSDIGAAAASNPTLQSLLDTLLGDLATSL